MRPYSTANVERFLQKNDMSWYAFPSIGYIVFYLQG